MKEIGLAETVGQSEAALAGLPLREAVDEVSDMCGEYLRCSGDLAVAAAAVGGGSMPRTRFALLAGTT